LRLLRERMAGAAGAQQNHEIEKPKSSDRNHGGTPWVWKFRPHYVTAR